MAVPQAGPTNQGAGAASDPTQALAQQLVDHIAGAEKRAKEQTAATGVVVSDQEAKEALVAEVAAMIKAVVPHPQSAPHKDSGKSEGKETSEHSSSPPSGRKY